MKYMEICEFLPWDSEFFGLRIGRVLVNHLGPSAMKMILEWRAVNEIQCLYFLADSFVVGDVETVRLAEANGFRLVDVRVTVERQTLPLPRGLSKGTGDGVRVRVARKEDVPAFEAIARTAYRDTRFYADGHFSKDSCDRLYETWIRRSCEGYADVVLAIEDADWAEVNSWPVGFVTCHLPKGTVWGSLGLLGIEARVRGRGLGQTLLTHALHWFAERGVVEVTAPIPGCNLPSQRLYQRLGFLTKSVQFYYHWWAE